MKVRRTSMIVGAAVLVVTGLAWPAAAFAGGGSSGNHGSGGPPHYSPPHYSPPPYIPPPGRPRPPGVYGPHGPTCSSSSSFGYPGHRIWVTGQGYAPDEPITLRFYGGGGTLGSAISDGNGSFSGWATIPANSGWGGETIVATGKSGDYAGTGITIEKW